VRTSVGPGIAGRAARARLPIVFLVAVVATVLGGGRSAASIGGCPVFPDDHVLNTRVDTLPVHPLSGAYVASIGAGVALHPDFGSPATYGDFICIPFDTGPGPHPPAPASSPRLGPEARPGAASHPEERPDGGRARQHGRPPRPRRGHGPLRALRAVRRLRPDRLRQPLDRRRGCEVRPERLRPA